MPEEASSLPARRGLSGAVLKWIAVASMFIDHAADVGYRTWYLMICPYTESSYRLYTVLRGVGRLAFPIYCFLLVEGFLHTHSAKKYLRRLICFGLISEVPFDRAFTGVWLDPHHQNVYFTLALGLLAIMLWDAITQHDFRACSWWRKLTAPLCAAALAVAAEYGNTDYGWVGVAVIVLMYVFRKRPWLRFLGSGAALLTSNVLEAASFPDYLLFRFYNGERGRQPKYFFYVFYPAHLALLAFARFLFLGY